MTPEQMLMLVLAVMGSAFGLVILAAFIGGVFLFVRWLIQRNQQNGQPQRDGGDDAAETEAQLGAAGVPPRSDSSATVRLERGETSVYHRRDGRFAGVTRRKWEAGPSSRQPAPEPSPAPGMPTPTAGGAPSGAPATPASGVAPTTPGAAPSGGAPTPAPTPAPATGPGVAPPPAPRIVSTNNPTGNTNIDVVVGLVAGASSYHERHNRNSGRWSSWSVVTPNSTGQFTVTDPNFTATDTVALEIYYIDATGNPSLAASATVNIT